MAVEGSRAELGTLVELDSLIGLDRLVLMAVDSRRVVGMDHRILLAVLRLEPKLNLIMIFFIFRFMINRLTPYGLGGPG